MQKKSQCSKCGCQIYDPFGTGKKLHNEETCLGITPTKDEGKSGIDKCYLTYVDGYLTCAYNHKSGEECLMHAGYEEELYKRAPTQHESWEEEFDNKIRQFEPRGWWLNEREVDMEGIKSFITKTLSTEKARWMKEWREKIGGLKIRPIIGGVLGPQDFARGFSLGKEKGYQLAREDFIKLTTPSEQEER